MGLDPARSEIFDQLGDELRLAPAPVPTVFAEVISGAFAAACQISAARVAWRVSID